MKNKDNVIVNTTQRHCEEALPRYRPTKQSKIMASAVFLLLMFLVGTFALAEIPHYMQFQGKATDANDVPLNSPHDLTFRIYDAETAGNLLWNETQVQVPIENGVFSVLLGSVTALDLPFDKPYWISTEINGSGEMPRTAITSTGYAYRAETVTIPFYRSGFAVEHVDSSNIRVSPGAIDISGALLSATDYSGNINVDSDGSYIEGNAASPGTWGYVYVYNNNGSVAYKLSTAFPNKADHNGNEAGQKRYYAPDGVIYYRCVGWFYYNSAGNIKMNEIGNIKESDLPNTSVSQGTTFITKSGITYTTIDDMDIHFYTSGRPVKVTLNVPIVGHATQGPEPATIRLNVGGIIKTYTKAWSHVASYVNSDNVTLVWQGEVPAGPVEIKAEWISAYTANTGWGASKYGYRHLIVEEL